MTEPPEVWLVDDDASIRWVLERALRQGGFRTRSFEQADAALTALAKSRPQVLITDVRMPGTVGLKLLELARRDHPELPVIVMTAHSDLEHAVAAYRGGAFEYLPKPFDIDEAVALVRRAATQGEACGNGLATGAIPGILGQAPAMQEVFRAIGRLSRSSLSVLVTGESGSGKELVARALHQHSPRAAGPFIALNTSAIASELLESELFGHEKGAFTGADTMRRGRFEQADGGTLFLDEIGDMSAALQTRLLRVLAEGEFYRVGGSVPVRVDVRVIAATHQDLDARVRDGSFREDLLHRLNVIRIRVPALRERRDDIPELLRHYFAQAARELGVESKILAPAARARLVAFDWPGNVRQLVNAARRLTVTAPGREIRDEDIPPDLGGEGAAAPTVDEWCRELGAWAERQLAAGGVPLLELALPEFERTLARAALASVQGRRQEAARLIGWGRNTLTRKLRELHIDDPAVSDKHPTVVRHLEPG
ncbi:MAG: nitrogen regulation protein NR(I) [Steroidobacteraceae bacterium]